MGAERFDHFAKGATPAAAFTAAREQAAYDHGHSGYTGTIAEKGGYTVRNGGKPLTMKEAQAFAETDGDDNDKWGDAYYVPVKANDSDSIIGYLFYGWASCVFALIFALAALPALAQANKPVTVKMPTLAAPVFRVPKPAAVQMPKPPTYTKRLPVVKPVHFPHLAR